MNPELREAAGEDERVDAKLVEDAPKVRLEERAVARLFHDEVAGPWGKWLPDLGALRPLERMGTPGVEVGVVSLVLVDDVHDRHVACPCRREALLECGDDRPGTRHLEEGPRLEVVVDHVDHDDGSSRDLPRHAGQELLAERDIRGLGWASDGKRGEHRSNVANVVPEVRGSKPDEAVLDALGTAGEDEREDVGEHLLAGVHLSCLHEIRVFCPHIAHFSGLPSERRPSAPRRGCLDFCVVS